MQTKYKIIGFLLIIGFVLIAGHVYESAKIQNQIDNYLDKNSELMEKKNCNLKDVGDKIILNCFSMGYSQHTRYNNTHDRFYWNYESSGGSGPYGDDFLIPHFEINKSKNLKLVKEDSRYLVAWDYQAPYLEGVPPLDYYSLREIIPYLIPLLTAIFFVIIIYFSYRKKP